MEDWLWGLRVVIFLLLGSKSAVCSREQFVGGGGRCQAMIPAALLSVLKRMGTGHAGSCSSCRASERQRKEQEEQDLGSFTELTCSPADLGSRTKQRVRASKFSWERERDSEVSSQQPGETCSLPWNPGSQHQTFSDRVRRERWLSSLPRNWTQVAWEKTRNPSCSSTRGQRLEIRFPWLSSPLIYSFLKKSKAVKTKQNKNKEKVYEVD